MSHLLLKHLLLHRPMLLLRLMRPRLRLMRLLRKVRLRLTVLLLQSPLRLLRVRLSKMSAARSQPCAATATFGWASARPNA